VNRYTAFQQGAFKPTRIPGNAFWLRADLGVTSGATFTWADQSGSGDPNKNATATGAARPTANPNNAGFNNKATIDYTSTQFLLTGVWAVPVPQPFSLFVVGDTPGTTSNYRALSDQGANWGVFSQGDLPSYIDGATVASPGDWRNPGALGSVIAASNGTLYFNSSHSYQFRSVGGAHGVTNMNVGGYLDGLSPAFNWAGSLAEVVLYNRVLSDPEISQLMTYFGTRYGIVIA